MRIVFDTYELIPGLGKSIGIYNYAKNLFKALLQAIDDETEIIVLCNDANLADFSAKHKSAHTLIIADAPGKISRLLWLFGRAAVEIKNLKADVYLSPKGFLPMGINLFSPGIRTAVVIHDLIPLWYREHYPGQFGWLEEQFINRSILGSAKSADMVIAISQATATDIVNRTGRKNGISVVHNGIAITRPGPMPFPQPYIFAMTSDLPHKNANGILAAYQTYRHLTDTPLPLVVCGISDPNQPGVTAVKGLDDTTLHGYYAHAELFVFLSLIEGFGFPPVEALAHGTKVLCSDIPALREVAKGLASYVAPNEPVAVAEKMAELLAQKDSAAKREQRMAILQEYSWAACADGVLDAIKSQPVASM